MTTLEIINQMLASTGTAPLTTNDTLHPFYIKALNKLSTVSASVQGRGWWFNQSTRTLKQDINGEVILPSTVLHADPVDTCYTYVKRGNKMYNATDATYVIGHDVELILVDEWAIEELPPQMAEYIKTVAVQEFYRDEDGGPVKLKEYSSARDTAWMELRREHLKNADVNWFNGTSHMQTRRGYRGNRLPI